MKPFHRLTNGPWPSKTIETNGWAIQKPLKNHRWQWSGYQKTFNGKWRPPKPLKIFNGLFITIESFQLSSQNHWNCQCSLQKTEIVGKVVVGAVTFSPVLGKHIFSRVEFTHFFDVSKPSWTIVLKIWKPSKNHWSQWLAGQKTLNGDSSTLAKPLKNHWCRWCPGKKH